MPSDDAESRRDFLGGIFTSAGKVVTRKFAKPLTTERISGPPAGSFLKLLQSPDSVRVFSATDVERLDPLRGGVWSGEQSTVKTYLFSDRMRISLECPELEPTMVAVRWLGPVAGIRRYLCPESSQEWRPEDPDRLLPGYFLAYDGKRTHGYGVAARPNAFCTWTADRSGITLWLDVRNGSQGVRLGDREIELCEVVCREGDPEESAYFAHQEFCRQMSPRPRLAGFPVYGMTDRFLTAGRFTPDQFVEAAKSVGELSPNETNRPFCVIEKAWNGVSDGEALATQLKGCGVRPGVGLRPLKAGSGVPNEWRLPADSNQLDPTHPDAAESITEMVGNAVDQGFELIRCPVSLPEPDRLQPSWSYHDRGRTSAEILNDLYDRIRLAAGHAVLCGEGVIPLHGAGVFEVANVGGLPQSTDTEAEIRRRAGALAFKGAWQGSFFAIDPSYAAVTGESHDRVLADWLRLLGESGTTMLVSVDPSRLGVEEWTMLRDAFGFAALEWPVAEPTDWMNSACPRKWRAREERVEFDWSTLDGPNPFSR